MLCFGSTYLEIDPNFTFLCELGLLLLFLCYLMRVPLQTWTTKSTQKHQGRAKRRRKGGTLKGWKCSLREEEELRKWMFNLRSPLGRHYDTIHIRQLLCPDPFCEVCNNTTAEIKRLLYPEALEDATPLASTVSVTDSFFTLSPAFSADLISASLPEPSPPSASTFLPKPMTSLADFFPPSPPDHSLPTEPFPPLEPNFPDDHFTSQPLAFSPVPPYDTQTGDPVAQPEANFSLNTIFSLDPILSQDVNPLSELSQTMNPTETHACHHAPPILSVSPPPDCIFTMTQSKCISITLKPVPENSSPDGPTGLSTYISKITGIDHAALSVSDFSWWKDHDKDFLPSTLAQCDFSQEFLALHSSKAPSRGDPAANLVEPGNLSFLSPEVLALLEKQVQKRGDFLLWKGKKKGSFPKQLRTDDALKSSGKMSESIAEKHDLAASLPFWDSKDKSKELHVPQQPPYPTNLAEGHIQQTPIQLFWGLPTLHSESLYSAAHVSDDCSSIFIFNRISSSRDKESPVLPQPPPLALPEIQPQPLPQPQPQRQPQPQPLPLTQLQPEAYLQSPLPILPSYSLPEIKICGVCVHRPQSESESLTSSEIQHLEWNVLQKQQASLWGLPSVVQRSHEDFCPPAPNLTYCRASQAHVAISICTGMFPLSDELRKKLEHHLRKRLIQHRWGLPRRINESLSLMMPPRNFSKIPEMEHSHGLLQISKSQSSQTLNVGLSQHESFHEGDSEMLQLEEAIGKDLANDPENVPKGQLVSDPKSSSDGDKGYDVEKAVRSLYEKKSRASVEIQGQRQLENVLKIHLSKKWDEIKEGRFPRTVHSSWHALKQTLLPPEKPHTEIQQRVLPPSVGGDYDLNASWELCFIDSNALQRLESHIKQFQRRMVQGLPPKVLESMAIFKLKEAPSQSLSNLNFPSSTNWIPGANSKSGAFKSHRESSKSLRGNKVRIVNSAPTLDPSLPTTSTVGKEGQGILETSLPHINHELAEDVQKIKDGRQTFQLIRHRTIDKARHRQTVPANRWPSKQSARQAGARREPKDKTLNPNDRVKMQQGKTMKNSEPVPVPKVSRDIIRAVELDAHQSKTRDILTTSKPGSSQMVNVNANNVQPVTRKIHSPNISSPQDPKLTILREQLYKELKLKLEQREHSRAQSQHNALPPSTYKPSLTHDQGDSSGDVGTSHVLHVHLEDIGISMEQQQEPWVPKHVVKKHQHKNLPPAAKMANPPCFRAQEFGGGDAGLGTSKRIRKSLPTQDVALKEKLGSQSSHTLSQKGLPLPESLFRKKMKTILLWLNSGRKCKRQENSQEKGSPPSVQSRGMFQGRAAFTGKTQTQKIMKDVGKILEEKMGHQHAIHSTCSQKPLILPAKFGKTQKEAQVQAQAQPVQGRPFNSRAPSCKEINTKSCYQEAVFVGHSYFPSRRQIMDKDRHPQKAVALKDQLLCQNYRLTVPHRKPVPHTCRTCRHRAGQGLPATLTTAKGTVFRDLSLLFRQKTLPQNFQAGEISHPKSHKIIP